MTAGFQALAGITGLQIRFWRLPFQDKAVFLQLTGQAADLAK